MMKYLYDAFRRLPDYGELLGKIKKRETPLACFGLTHPHRISLCATLRDDLGVPIMMILPSEAEASKTLEDLSSLGLRTLWYPSREYSPRTAVRSLEYEHKRIGTLSELSDRAFDVLVTTPSAACQRTVTREMLAAHTVTLCAGLAPAPRDLIAVLTEAGYERSEKTEGAGQFSVRGGIIDFFSPAEQYPVRADYWDDEIDSLSYFDPVSQRRTENADKVRIVPVTEACISKDELALILEGKLDKKLTDKRREVIYRDIDLLKAGVSVPTDRYADEIFGAYETLLDHFYGPVFVCDSLRVKDALSGAYTLAASDMTELCNEGLADKGSSLSVLGYDEFISKLENGEAVFLESLPRSGYSTAIKGLFSFTMKQISPVATLSALADDIPHGNGCLTVILAGEQRTAESLAAGLRENGIPAVCVSPDGVAKSGVFVTTGTVSSGLEIPLLNFSLIPYGKAMAARRRPHYKKGADIGSLDELKVGDAVVHSVHGIGIFDGIRPVVTKGIKQDYIKIRYRGSDVLYVPVTSLDMVSRYIGASDESGIKLNRLGSPEWSRTRARVKKAVKDIAKQLTELYAKRMQVKGFAFSEDCDLQRDFEQRFPYDETSDQLRCIDEIKGDMQSSVPMDRLLCGDVGFGKTEVALRAAFKCILDGKQCAILVPTTILAWQHFTTANERFSGMPVTVDMLSRFRTPKETAKIKKRLTSGNIDLIVGTHRIISSDIKFRDLGLLIIDEEQRFGVAQKERLKELFPNVDVLTLSATPIPRTLNMALSGLRDMSSIEEAPHDRLPVQTYVMEQNNGVIFEAISKELNRGGQVYYLHNRVESINAVAARIKLSFPDASVSVAHGKMSEDELSDVWQRLLEHETDILVCTTIIETGIDVPNVNTLIIEDADRFGLAQLHQLRGRVGRSHRRAYAYLFFKTGKALTDISQKRLEAIREFTEFGSGYRIAMRDLEIRGAGSVLGGEQHGHMEAVGYDMYLRLLGDAIAEEKGEARSVTADCSIDIRSNARIPEEYITDLSQRLEMYRRIAAIRTEEDREDVTDELIDRFGEPPACCLELMKVALLKSRCIALGFTDISERGGSLVLSRPDAPSDAVLALYAKFSSRLTVSSSEDKNSFSVKLKDGENAFSLLEAVLDTLENFRK